MFKSIGNEESTYIILSGVASAECYLASGEVVIIELLGKGYSIGEFEPFLQQKIYYVIQALTPVIVCQLDKVDLAQLIEENPIHLLHITSAMENNMRSFARHSWVMNAQRIQERIKRLLSNLVILSGGSGEETRIDLTHEELARLINTDRTSVTRGLHRLEKEGFVRLGYDRLWVVNPLISKELTTEFRFDPLARNISNLAIDRLKR